MQHVLEIRSDDSPEPDLAIVEYRADFYKTRHPNGGDAVLVIEVGDTERNAPEKMRAYMADGRFVAWRVDIPKRCVELWSPALPGAPSAILRDDDTFAFENVAFVVNDIFAGLA